MSRYAEIIVNKAVEVVNRVFHYLIPQRLANKVKIGSVVVVPFGKQVLEGVVVGLTNNPEVPLVREIKDVVSPYPLFHKDLIELACWMADYYMCPKVLALQNMLPGGLKLSEKNISAKKIDCAYLTGNSVDLIQSKAYKQKEIISYLKNHNGETIVDILRATQASRSVLKALVNKGIVKIISEEVYRDPYSGKKFSVNVPKALSCEQEAALKTIRQEYIAGRNPVLLHGVTGSGKTEIYLRLIEDMIEKGKQSIVLVPEIALTPQMVATFKSRLGHHVAVFHSRLSKGERRDAWMHIASGRLRVVVGARSAVFTPCKDLGLIIIDEEQEQSYKQDNAPRFHTREIALQRVRLSNALLVMGSATPSVETYYKAVNGEYRLVVMTKRINNRPMADVHVVDMRKELKTGNKSVLSRLLQEKLVERFNKKEQTLLFLNRRGYNTFVSCRSCGHVLVCPHCDISLTFHASDQNMKCHYCGFTTEFLRFCPKCCSKAIRYFGTGTQKIEEEVKRLLPKARVVRVDTDTASHKGFYDFVFGEVRKGEVDVLVGTQMIAKGLDFPKVTLVGVVSADMLLHLPEMRAAERTFQLITQVAGRAGRGELPGEVVLQTYTPEDPAILAAARQDYREFFKNEIKKRKQLGYPPYGVIIRILLTSINQERLERNIKNIARYIEAELAGKALLLGPAPAPLERIKDRYRRQVIIKGHDLAFLRMALTQALEKGKHDGYPEKDVLVSIDVEPLNLI
ncbi:MAG: primosomal protein N' [Bacillota bacterium]